MVSNKSKAQDWDNYISSFDFLYKKLEKSGIDTKVLDELIITCFKSDIKNRREIKKEAF